MNDFRKNHEGYFDPTAYAGLIDIVKTEQETDRKATVLIKILKFIIRSSGFELMERIQIKEIRTGRKYK